jgi:hypothetical protein
MTRRGFPTLHRRTRRRIHVMSFETGVKEAVKKGQYGRLSFGMMIRLKIRWDWQRFRLN